MFEGNYKDDPSFLKEICLILQYSYLILFTETQFSSHNLELSNLKQKRTSWQILNFCHLRSNHLTKSIKLFISCYLL